MPSYPRVPFKPPQYPEVPNLSFEDTGQITPYSNQELDARESQRQAQMRLQESLGRQNQVQQGPSGIEGVVASPWVQLGVPAALTALSAISPRYFAPAASIGMAGFRTASDTVASNQQRKRTTVADEVQQRYDDMLREKLNYQADRLEDPAERESVKLLISQDSKAAADYLLKAANKDKFRAERGQMVENPPEGFEASSFNVQGPEGSIQFTRPEADQGQELKFPGLGSLPIAYPQQENEDQAAWVQRLLGIDQQRKVEQARANKAATIDPVKARQAEDHAANMVYGAKALASGRWQDMVNPIKMLSARADGGEARMTMLRMAEDFAKAEGKKLDPALLETKFKMIDDYFNGATSRNLVSLNTAMAHIGGVFDAMQNVTLLDSPAGNRALQKYWETVESNPDFARYLTSLSGPKKEVAGFLLNNRALYESDRQEFDRLAAEYISSGAMQEVLKEWIHLSAARATALNNKFKKVFHDDLPDIFDEEAEEAARKVGYPVIEPSEKQAAQPTQSGGKQAPEGTIIEVDGKRKIKRGGAWVDY